MTDTPTAVIAAAPIVDALQPLITALIAGVTTGIVGIILTVFNSWKARWTAESAEERAQDEADQKLIADAVGNEAGKIAAKSLTNEFANKTFTLGSPEVTQAAQSIIGAKATNLKSALKSTGATPELVNSLVLGEVGKLQAKVTSVTAPQDTITTATQVSPDTKVTLSEILLSPKS